MINRWLWRLPSWAHQGILWATGYRLVKKVMVMTSLDDGDLHFQWVKQYPPNAPWYEGDGDE